MVSSGKEGREELNVSKRDDVPAKSEVEETRRPDAPCERGKMPYVPPKGTLVKGAKNIQALRETLKSGGRVEVEG